MPASIYVTVFIDTPTKYARANDAKVRGGHAFVGDAGGLRVLDVRNPSSPHEVAWTKLPGLAEVVRLAGNHAFVMEPYCPDGPSIVRDPPIFGLQVIDISRPTQPVKVNRSSVTNHNHLKGFALANGWAYLMDNCLRPVDLSDLTAPRLAGEVENRSGVRYNDICGVSNRLYVAGSTGLEIYDVSTPSQPHLMGTVTKDTSLPDYRAGGFCVDVAWPYAYVADGDGELLVVDVTVPAEPKLIGSCGLHGLTTCLQVQGKHVFAADKEGIRAVDVSRPEHPVLAGEYALPGEIKRIAVEGDYVYVCDWRDLIILRLEYPGGR